MKKTPKPRYLHTICVDCRIPLRGHESEREAAREIAAAAEADWATHPVEVGECRCRRCRRWRHWWFFILDIKQTERLELARRATDTVTQIRPNAAEGMAKIFNQDNPATQATQATGKE